MWTGTAALRDIDGSLQTIRNDVVRLDSQLSQLTATLAANQRQRVKLIKDIAAVRLTEIDSGELQTSLTAADHDAAEILQQRDAALELLHEEIERLNQQIVDAEQQRDGLLAKLNSASQQLVDVEANVQAALKSDASYMQLFEQASAEQAVSDEAERKVEQAQADMAEKAAPYQQDELFMYLWNRGYGTTKYKGGLFARFMDGWVARLIKFQESRINFWNLTEIPQRLAEHADRVAEIADQAHMTLQQKELDALQQAGSDKLRVELDTLRDSLDRHDDALEDMENNLNSKLEDRARFVSGGDNYIKRCIERLTQALDHQDLDSVRRYVQATHSPTDDRLVIELQSLSDRLQDVAEDLDDVRALHNNKLNRLKELEGVRRDFKNSRYDDVRSGFGNQALIVNVLGQFLQGVVSGADLWRVIQRNQRYRNVGSVPDFGSGGLGDIGEILSGGSNRRRERPSRRSTWNWPAPRRGGGGFKIPRGGGGGFKTGGGF